VARFEDAKWRIAIRLIEALRGAGYECELHSPCTDPPQATSRAAARQAAPRVAHRDHERQCPLSRPCRGTLFSRDHARACNRAPGGSG
jgi:hypothetical protein